MRGVWLLHADTLQPAVRFGGSFPVYDATVSNRPRHRPHVLVETDEHDHCALPVLYSWTALCEKNGRIQRLDTASLQLLTSVTWHQFSYDSATVMLPVSAPISLIPYQSYPHIACRQTGRWTSTWAYLLLPCATDSTRSRLQLKYRPIGPIIVDGKWSCNNFDSLLYLSLFCVHVGLCQLNNTK